MKSKAADRTLSTKVSGSPCSGKLTLPKDAIGLVILAQEKDSSASVYNHAVAEILNKNYLATFEPDLDAEGEKGTQNPQQVAERLGRIAIWAHQNPETAMLPVGIFAPGDNALAALLAVVWHPEPIKAIVLQAAERIEEASETLSLVKAPVLLVAAGRDQQAVRAGQEALKKLELNSAINIIPYASGAFQEPGAMDQAAQIAAYWFLRHLA